MTQKIILAGGCFWGVEAYFKKLKGVVDTTVGYVNGNIAFPTYEQVCNGVANHAEACEVVYDPSIISLSSLIEHLFRFIDPFSLNKQGHDVGVQYRTGIYVESKEDEMIAAEFLSKRQQLTSKPIKVELAYNKGFYAAELYHQDYLDKNPFGYCHVDFSVIRKEEQKS
jgi:peptide-methionine (S)-S-oxide reductase